MSENSGAVTTGSGVVGVILEEPESTGASGSRQQAQAPERAGTLRCALWPRQQTWLCAVPLLIGFIGLGLSLMLLKWIVVGSVRDYVPTDLVDAKGIGQDPIFLSKPSAFPKGSDTTTTTTTTTNGPVASSSPGITTSVRGKTRSGTPPNTSHRGSGASGSQVTQKSTTQRSGTRGPTTTTAYTTTSSGRTSTSSPSPSNPTVLNDSTQMWTREQPSTERPVTTPARTHISRKTRESIHFVVCFSGPSGAVPLALSMSPQLEHPHTVPADGAVGVEVEGHQVFWTCDSKPFILVLTTVPPHTDWLGVSTKTKAGLVTEDDPLPF
ncbi:hypothetical protein NFI96_003716 [Prochilodus magdalenae]|nr:hypothetical protein NFI96_003716 [Prochilodus magdalenae]